MEKLVEFIKYPLNYKIGGKRHTARVCIVEGVFVSVLSTL